MKPLKIVVISDTHGDKGVIQKIALQEYDADYYFHLGDSELFPSDIEPFVSVEGNRDYPGIYPKARKIKTDYGSIFMEHGLKITSIGPNYAYAQDCLIYLFGHTHCHMVSNLDKNHYIANPGSLTRPRDGSSGTYLIITLDENGPQFNFKSANS